MAFRSTAVETEDLSVTRVKAVIGPKEGCNLLRRWWTKKSVRDHESTLRLEEVMARVVRVDTNGLQDVRLYLPEMDEACDALEVALANVNSAVRGLLVNGNRINVGSVAEYHVRPWESVLLKYCHEFRVWLVLSGS